MQTKLDSKVLVVSGAGLLALAAVFLWRQYDIDVGALVAVAAVVAALSAVTARGKVWPLIGPAALIGFSIVGAVWYGGTKSPVMLFSLAVTFLGSLAAVARSAAKPETAEGRLQSVFSWLSLALGFLAVTGATYFELFTLNLADEAIGRRAVLTLFWMASGVALVLFARKKERVAARDAGFVVLAAALGKALLYDTMHLDGLLRIGLFAASGLLLLAAGGVVLPRLSSSNRVQR